MAGKGESRSYRLRRRESVPDGVRRIARGRIDHALDELRGRSHSTPVEAVHGARKDTKKLRALLRLVRGELGEGRRRREDARFRDAARALAATRDADVLLSTLSALEERFPEDLPADVAGGLRQALEVRGAAPGAAGRGSGTTTAQADAARQRAMDEAIGLLEQARGEVERWPLKRDRFAAFEDGLERSYRRGRRDLRALREQPSVEGLHDWRKRAKELWYHLTLLEDMWPPVVAPLAEQAHELSDRLGDDHDLALLLQWAHEHATALDGMERVHAFEALVQRRRGELQAEAFALGARLYADRPDAHVHRLEGWWDGWRQLV